MAHRSSFPATLTGKHFLVSGLSEGSAVFCGCATSEPIDEQLTLEGKLVHISPEGRVLAQPFRSQVRFFLLDATFTIHHVDDPHIHNELVGFLDSNQILVSSAAFPFLYGWYLATCRHPEALYDIAQPRADHPAFSFFEQFVSTAEQFRRALYRAPQVSSVRELDKVSELEGNLLVEIGKIASQVAIKLNQLVSRESDLQKHFRAFYGEEVAGSRYVPHAIGGFAYLTDRLNFAKNYARSNGKSGVVREINAFLKDAFFGLNEVVMDHRNSLDTLITESFSQYGITYEMYGETLLQSFSRTSEAQVGKPFPHPSPVGAS